MLSFSSDLLQKYSRCLGWVCAGLSQQVRGLFPGAAAWEELLGNSVSIFCPLTHKHGLACVWVL